MSTHPYKHRSKPSNRSIRLSTLASMIGYYKHAGEWYDGKEETRFVMDEMAMWAQPERNPHEIIFHNKKAYDQFSDGVDELYFRKPINNSINAQ